MHVAGDWETPELGEEYLTLSLQVGEWLHVQPMVDNGCWVYAFSPWLRGGWGWYPPTYTTEAHGLGLLNNMSGKGWQNWHTWEGQSSPQ